MEYELTNQVYRIKEFDKQLANCAKFIAETLEKTPSKIITADDRRAVKSARANINKQIKALKDFRLELNRQVLGTINEQIKELEKTLSAAEAQLKEIVDADKGPKAPEPSCLKIYSFDQKALDTIKKYAERKFGSLIDIL